MAVLEKTTEQNVSLAATPRIGKRLWIVGVSILAALAVATVTLAVSFVMSAKGYQQQLSSNFRQISALEQRLEELQKQQQDTSSRLEEQNNTIRDQQTKLEEKDKTISDLKTQIALKKAQQQPQQPQTIVQTPPTPIAVDVSADLSRAKLVALTFDDGPGPYTARLLDALNERGIRATFFVQGPRVDTYADLIRRMEAEGHVVGNHSQNHKNLKTLSAAGVKNEMNACADRIEKVLGHRPIVMRCPYGNCNNTVKSYAAQEGVAIIQWDVDTLDWKYRNTSSIMNYTFKNVRDGSIILMHDIHSTTVDAVPSVVDRLLREGYTFVTVPELLAARGGMVAGKVYSGGYKR